jgi:RNase P subunit RPR2
MEIIKRGILPGKIKYQKTCNKCGTIFSFLQSEARIHCDQRDGDCMTINCPYCEDFQYVNKNDRVWE